MVQLCLPYLYWRSYNCRRSRADYKRKINIAVLGYFRAVFCTCGAAKARHASIVDELGARLSYVRSVGVLLLLSRNEALLV